MHAFTSDIRFAIRMLGRRPLLPAAAVLSLALGIGLASGVFGLLEAAVLRPLPVRSPNELRVILEIRDSGEGMSEEFIRRRLFKPFDTTKGSSGMGIGVYQAREVVRSLGGDIFVKSTLGVGTTVSSSLPLTALA